MFRTLSVLAGLVGVAAILSAQAIDPDTFKVNYFNFANVLDSTVHMTNAGTSGGNLCASIYVFDPNQELSECCSCLLTPDGLDTFSVITDLTHNPLTGPPYLKTGIIKIVSAATTAEACPLPTAPKPSPGIHAWATHLEGGEMIGAIVETDFQDAGLSAKELASLGSQCSAIKLVGSGKGVCTCPENDLSW